jgi:hypothetical protein
MVNRQVITLHYAYLKFETQNALDELFTLARKFRTGEEYFKLMNFVTKFRFYSPYNAMLIYAQRPGARYVAPANRWMAKYRRGDIAAAIPIVILRPRGPVMFVFDVSDTEPLEGAKSLPEEVENPFEVRGGSIGSELKTTVENALRDGISVSDRREGAQSAGFIRSAQKGLTVNAVTRRRPSKEYVQLPRLYELLLNSSLSDEAKYATLTHELGHLYCGHLGTPSEKWWPNRQKLGHIVEEFEAESVCYLVCGRLGIDNPSDKYLADFMKDGSDVPNISLEIVTKAAGLIERMGKEHLPLRKD